eukprot:TRINITY_DN18433_c0_g1_i2.p1 TRINITY_DN18433_c0_g1~~TRINITY_DN18433_c0_g1_i2.p1  ORF type:complete len:124 (-),score=33.24 TRINITY_DN18433_c0_g1_i2:123-494(-)
MCIRDRFQDFERFNMQKIKASFQSTCTPGKYLEEEELSTMGWDIDERVDSLEEKVSRYQMHLDNTPKCLGSPINVHYDEQTLRRAADINEDLRRFDRRESNRAARENLQKYLRPIEEEGKEPS